MCSLLSYITTIVGNTWFYPIRHRSYKIAQNILRYLRPSQFEVIFQTFFICCEWHWIQLTLEYCPQIFYRIQVRRICRPYFFRPKTFKVLQTPLLSSFGGMSRRPILLENGLGHVFHHFSLINGSIFSFSFKCRHLNFLQNVLYIVFGIYSLTSRNKVQFW